MKIHIKKLDTGYYHARGDGPCNWAQWPVGEPLSDEHFFPEAGEEFRQQLMSEFLEYEMKYPLRPLKIRIDPSSEITTKTLRAQDYVRPKDYRKE